MNLFGDPELSEDIQITVNIPDLEEFSRRDMMAMEKETTGIYLSGHPMDEYRAAAKRVGAVPTATILEAGKDESQSPFRDGQLLTVAGIVQSVRTRTTKSNTLMSYIVLEDDSGSIELIAFSRALDSYGSLIKENNAVVVRGKLSLRDEKEPQLTVEQVRSLEGDAQSPVQKQPSEPKLWVKLDSIADPVRDRIELILTMFPGSGKMIIYGQRENKKLSAPCLIHPSLVAELKELLGDENVVVK